MLGDLLTGGLLFLAGLTSDGTIIGLGARHNSFEYQLSYLSAPRETYTFNNFLNFNLIPTRIGLKPLQGENSLNYSCIAIRAFKRWSWDTVVPIEYGIGINTKVWFLNYRYNEKPYDRYSFGPSFIFSVYSTKEKTSGIRIMVENNLTPFKQNIPVNEIAILLFINIEFDWSSKPPKDE